MGIRVLDGAAAGRVVMLAVVAAASVIGTGSATAAKPAAKTIAFTSAAYSAGETSGTASISVVRSSTSGTASVDVSTSDGTATAGTDYTSLTNHVVSFGRGQSTATFSVSILDDATSGEVDQTVNLTLTQPSKGYALGSQKTSVLTITEDPAPSSAPTGLGMSTPNSFEVDLTWDSTASATSYAVYRSTNGTSFDHVATSATNSYTDDSVSPSTTYYYEVAASNDDGDSAPSSAVSGTTPTNLVGNGGFETGDLTGWNAGNSGTCLSVSCTQKASESVVPVPSIDTGTFFGGSSSAFLGQPASCGGLYAEDYGSASLTQDVAVPDTGTTTLTFWTNLQTSDGSTAYDAQQALVLSSTDNSLLATVMNVSSNRSWTKTTYDLSSFHGRTVRLLFRVYEDGNYLPDCTAMNVDDVSVNNS